MISAMMDLVRAPALLCALGIVACGSSDPPLSEALAKADAEAKQKKEAEAKKKEEIKVEKKDPLAHPWTFDTLKGHMKMGTVLVYGLTGKDAKGKPVEDEYVCEIKGNDDKSVKVNQHRKSQLDDPVSKQVATLEWTNLSPCFSMEKPNHEVARRESVTVPAGSFEAVVAEANDFFGNHRTFWLIPDQAGVYAKVVDHGNENEDGDETELVYELREIRQSG